MKLRILSALLLIGVGANAATVSEDLPKTTGTVHTRSNLDFLSSIEAYNATSATVANFEAEAQKFAEKYKAAQNKAEIDRAFQEKISSTLNLANPKELKLSQHLSAFYNDAKFIAQ